MSHHHAPHAFGCQPAKWIQLKGIQLRQALIDDGQIQVRIGPGITMLQEGNSNAEHIRSLKVQGVVFDVCQNTIDTWEKNNGKPFPISAQARRVPSGVAQIMTLVEHGYTPVRP